MELGREVVEIRSCAGLTQQQLSDLSGVAQPNIAAYEKGTRRPSPKMLDRLAAAAKPRPSTALARHRGDVMELVRKHHGSDPRVFGSVARGEDVPGSDVDHLVRFDARASLYDLVDLQASLEELLGVSVDVVSEGGLRESTSIPGDAKAL